MEFCFASHSSFPPRWNWKGGDGEEDGDASEGKAKAKVNSALLFLENIFDTRNHFGISTWITVQDPSRWGVKPFLSLLFFHVVNHWRVTSFFLQKWVRQFKKRVPLFLPDFYQRSNRLASRNLFASWQNQMENKNQTKQNIKRLRVDRNASW